MKTHAMSCIDEIRGAKTCMRDGVVGKRRRGVMRLEECEAWRARDEVERLRMGRGIPWREVRGLGRRLLVVGVERRVRL